MNHIIENDYLSDDPFHLSIKNVKALSDILEEFEDYQGEFKYSRKFKSRLKHYRRKI